MLVVTFVIVAVLITLVPVSITAIAAKALGIGVPKLAFGAGAPWLRAQLGSTEVTLSPWLVTSWVALKDPASKDIYPHAVGRDFSDAPLFIRLLLTIAGFLVMLAACAIFLRDQFAPVFISALPQIWSGALGPLSSAQESLTHYAALATRDPLTAVVVAVTKLAAFNLVPIPPLAGGQFLAEFARGHSPSYASIYERASHYGTLFLLVPIGAWLLALASFLLR